MVHISRLNTAYEIWKSLEAIHETRDYQVAISIQHDLFRQCATDNDDLVEHLTKLKKDWERLNVLDNDDLHITDIQFKTIIASSLPPSWDAFAEPYVGRRRGIIETDPKKLMSSQQFIGIIKEEYSRRKARKENGGIQSTTQIYYSQANNKCSLADKRLLADRITPQISVNNSSGMLCRNCGLRNHITDDCRWLGKSKCEKCNRFHIGTECRCDQKRKWNDTEGGQKRMRQEQTHIVTEKGDGGHSSGINEITFTAEEAAGACNFDQPFDKEGNDERLLFYDWLADSATTSHVTNMRNAFTSFQPFTKAVNGVGNAQTYANGRGTIAIKTKVDNKEFRLTLKDVLYIPMNPQNLVSLGRWDKAGGNYHGGQGGLTMNTNNGETVAKGTRINNHLYRLD